MENRKEWLLWRKMGLGASDVSALYGCHTVLTPFKLWLDKITPEVIEEESNFATQMGNDLEPKARARFAALYNLDHFSDETFEPARIQSGFMMASLDGASKDMKTILEIKFMSRPGAIEKLTPGKRKHLAVVNDSLPVTHDTDAMGRVPYGYWIQIQHQLLVSGADSCFFISYEPQPDDRAVSMHYCEVKPNTEFMRSHIEKCANFWSLVLSKTRPDLIDADYSNLRSKGATALAQKYKQTRDGAVELFSMMTDDLQKIDGLYLHRSTQEILSCPQSQLRRLEKVSSATKEQN